MATKPFTPKELAKIDSAQIAEELPRMRTRLYELRQQGVTEKLENTREPRNIRRRIAQLLTKQKMLQMETTHKETA